MPQTGPPETADSPPSLRDAATLFNLIAHPQRLEVLARIVGGTRTVGGLCEALGLERRQVAPHLQTLVQSGLVVARQDGRARWYEPTEVGRVAMRAVDATLGRGDGPAPSPEPPAPAPAAPRPGERLGRLHALLKALADPTRLRILNLLAACGEVCVCHIHGALEVPQSTASRHLGQLRDAGLIVGRREGTWAYYRLAAPADTLHGALVAALEPKIAADEVLEADRRRLAERLPCAGG